VKSSTEWYDGKHLPIEPALIKQTDTTEHVQDSEHA